MFLLALSALERGVFSCFVVCVLVIGFLACSLRKRRETGSSYNEISDALPTPGGRCVLVSRSRGWGGGGGRKDEDAVVLACGCVKRKKKQGACVNKKQKQKKQRVLLLPLKDPSAPLAHPALGSVVGTTPTNQMLTRTVFALSPTHCGEVCVCVGGGGGGGGEGGN